MEQHPPNIKPKVTHQGRSAGRAACIISPTIFTIFTDVRLPSKSTVDPPSDEGVALISLAPRPIRSAEDGFGIWRRRGILTWDEDMVMSK